MISVRKIVAFLFLSLLVAFIVCYRLDGALAIDEVVDDYTDTSMVNLTDNVVRNPVRDVMELGNATGPEDFTGYIEVDGGGDLTVTTDRVAFDTMRRQADDYVYRDFGVGYFDDFIHNFTVCITDLEAGGAFPTTIAAVWLVSDVVGTQDEAEHVDCIMLMLVCDDDIDDKWRYIFFQYNGGVLTTVWEYSAYYNLATHYITIEKSGVRMDAYIYSDSDRLNLLESIGDNGVDDSYRYFEPVASAGKAPDAGEHVTGYVEDVYLGEISTSGYFTTTNLMSGLDENVTVVLLNTSIPSGSINLEWSPDGAAWSDLGPLPTNTGCDDLRGFASKAGILRFNFTRGAPLTTPRLYQTRLIHEGGVTRAAVDVNIYYALAIILLLIGLMVGSRVGTWR